MQINVDEEKLNNFLESSATVEIEVNSKISTLKTKVKMKIESVTASPPPTQRLENDNRTKRYIKQNQAKFLLQRDRKSRIFITT